MTSGILLKPDSARTDLVARYAKTEKEWIMIQRNTRACFASYQNSK